MFYLVFDDKYHYLVPNETYTVGRINCDILIENANINRKHAILRVKNNSIEVEDHKSLSGTYINGVNIKLAPHNLIKENFEISLGKFVVLKVFRVDFNVTSYGIDDKEQQEVIAYLNTLHGQYYDKQSNECRMLISNKILLNVEHVRAIACGLRIVTVDFLKEAANAVKESAPFPEVDKYFPRKEISENFQMNANRKDLFVNKVFFGSIPEQVQDIIRAQGGEILSTDKIDEVSDNLEKFFVKYPNCSNVDSSKFTGEVVEKDILLTTIHVDCKYLNRCNKSKRSNQTKTSSVNESLVMFDSDDEPNAKRTRRNFCDSPEPELTRSHNSSIVLHSLTTIGNDNQKSYDSNGMSKKISINDMEVIRWLPYSHESLEEENDD